MHHAIPDAEITGVDIEPQPRYPFKFIQADALTFPLDGYDFIWASPPCQAYSLGTARWRIHESFTYPDIVIPVEQKLNLSGIPYVIENVPQAPLINHLTLCGLMFGMRTLRHRIFQTNFKVVAPFHPKHEGRPRDGVYVTVAGGGAGGGNGANTYAEWAKVMRIDWMNKKELAHAVPPDYARYVMEQWLLTR